MEEAMNHLKTALLLAGLISAQAHAAITVRDDDGNAVTLARPAQRILALAPHVTELLFAAGGGEKIAGVVSYSDYPEAAKKIPQVGDNRQYDMERIIAMKPDLIVVWMHGSAERQIAMLRQLKVPIYHSEPRKLADIPDSIVADLAEFDERITQRGWEFDEEQSNDDYAVWFYEPSGAQVEDGLPVTNRNGHGRGMRSLALFRDKYKATVLCNQQDGWFKTMIYVANKY